MKKKVSIYVGTEIPFSSPTHPYSCAVAAANMIDKILALPDVKFEIKTNSEHIIRVFQLLGRQKGLSIQYYINGKKASYKEVLKDFARADEYINQIISTQ